MTTMTYSEFDELVAREFNKCEQEQPGEWRIGQVYFNTLLKVRPDIAEEMRGSLVDPFFKHRVTEVVKMFVWEKW